MKTSIANPRRVMLWLECVTDLPLPALRKIRAFRIEHGLHWKTVMVHQAQVNVMGKFKSKD